MSSSRTTNAIRNMIFGLINKITVLIFPFIIRTVLIRTLGSEYLGLNSLFVSILQVLNLAELGFSSAIIYSMYKPIAKKDTKTICALMKLYKKIYRVIGIIIIIVGLALLPFLNYLIKGNYPSNINIYILYTIYLLNTGITYFLFAYKSALLTAHQRNDIVSNVQTITFVLQYGLQIFILVKLKNYYLFVSIQILTTVLNNIIVALITNKKYSKYVCRGEVNAEIKEDIKKRVTGLMIERICSTTRNSLDSIFISAFLGLNMVAMYSNYYSIMHSILGIIGIITPSLIAGIGNSIVTESKEKNYDDMNKLNFIYMWLSGWCTICLACLFQPFMKIWMGEQYMFQYGIVILFCIYFYSLKMGDIRAAYSDAKGLWYENRYRAIAETIANVLLNILLVKFLGIYGIILGTLISLLIINFGYGSQIIFRHYFTNEKISDYFKNHAIYALVTLTICTITYFICKLIKLDGITGLIIKFIICCTVPNALYLIIYCKTKIFKESMVIFKKVIKPFLKKLTKLKKYIKHILPILTLIITLITIIAILRLNILPNKYLILLIIVEAILFLLSLIQLLKKKALKIIGIVISIISILINIFGLYYINNTNSFLNKKFTGDITYSSTYYVITNKENNATLDDIEDIKYYKYSYNVEKAKELLGEFHYQEIDKIETLKKNEYLLIDEYIYKLIKEETKIIYEFNIEWSEKRVSNKQESYNIFIGGRDFTRTLMDFNMIITINTKTKTILLTNIPRDYYLYIPEYKMNDSLEFMGLLGENTTMNALENLLDTKIDLYASIYTEGLVEIVDLLGGIEYCSNQTFTTTHAMVLDTYNDYGEKLTIYQGCQHLNGIETLTVARERKHVGSDRQRQKNCTKILKSILEKSLSMTTLTNYEGLLNKVSNLYQTNMDKNTIQKLIKSLINNKYKIIEQSLDGTDGTNYIRLGTVQSYVMYPNEGSVNNAKEQIKKVLQEK